jgi:carbamoyltransferase
MAFYRATCVPVLLNTSFNVAGEPIIETPADALFDLVLTDIDVVMAHDWLIQRSEGRAPGLLDLRPVLCGHKISAADAKAEKLQKHCVKVFDGHSGKPLDAYFRVNYPLGPMAVHITQDQMALIMLITGQRTGWELLELARKILHRPEMPPQWLETQIAALARRRVIVLTTADGDHLKLV